MRWHKLAGAGVTVAAAAAAGSLIAGGVGNAAPTAATGGGRSLVRGMPAPQVSKAMIKAAATPATSAATDRIYMKITGVTGEVVDGPYSGALKVYSWSWGMSVPPSSKADTSDLNVSVPYDRATPLLEKKAEDHTTFLLQETELDSTNQKIRELDLTDARVDSLQIGSSLGDGVPTVSISFSYAKEVTTYWYTNSSGALAQVKSCWDVVNGLDCGASTG